MKRILFFLILLVSSTFSAFAQESTTPPVLSDGTKFENFKVSIYTKSQSAWNKSVPIYVQFVATRSSDTVQIDWDAPSGVEIKSSNNKFISVVQGQTYTFKANVVPIVSGTYNIAANVILWESKTNYTSSANTTIVFDDDLLTVPLSQDYTIGVVIKYVSLILTFVILVFFGVRYFIKSKKKFDKWFNLPD